MFTLEVETGNAAFHDEYGEYDDFAMRFELARILTNITNKILDGYQEGTVADINGNRCGKWKIK